MASVDDVDTQQAVGKFLRRQSVTPPADNQANTADEITAVLETIATSFLLYPQAALTIVMNAKNSFQQVVQADLSVIEFLLAALKDVENRDIPVTDTSDLVEAQTALIELDRLGRVNVELQAFGRYRAAIDRFLDEQLAPTLKRNGTKTLERTGNEAREDIFSILPQFAAAHTITAALLLALQNSVDDFRSVNLTNLVSSLTLTRVRDSLTRVRARIQAGTISKTTVAIELLSGAASLSSISDIGDLFDPTIQTGALPTNTNINARPEDVKATALSSAGPWTLGATPWNFVGSMDPLAPVPQAYSFVIPGSGASGRAYVSSEGLTATFNVPVNSRLYVHFTGSATTEFQIALTSGPAVTIATLISDIDTALGVHGDCIQNPNTFGFLIFGSALVTSIVIRTASSGAPSLVTDPSAHALLGFADNQASLPVNQFTAESLFAAIHNRLPSGTVAVEGNALRITSTLADSALSSLFFDDGAANSVQDNFGFTGTVEAQPSYLELVDDSTVQILEDLGVFVGSVVTVAEDPAIAGSTIRTLNNEAVTAIDGTRLFFGPGILLPRRSTTITVISPVVALSQTLVRDLEPFVGTFDEDVAKVQRILSPIISKPTKAQIGDARRVLEDVQTRLTALLDFLQTVVVRADRSQFSSVAANILSALEERGLDRAQELLSSGQFSVFFSLSSATASKSNRLLTAIEAVAIQDLPVSTLEVDIDDDQTPRGTNPDSNVLDGAEIDSSGSLVGDF